MSSSESEVLGAAGKGSELRQGGQTLADRRG